MEKYETKTNESQNFNFDDITRCPKCNLICLLTLIKENNKFYINYYCDNKHEGKIELKEYMIKIIQFQKNYVKIVVYHKKIKMKNLCIVQIVISLFVIIVLKNIRDIIYLVLINMILYVKNILIYFLLIVLIVKKIFVLYAIKNMRNMI